jgi:glycosyltransferase involved in cell wall biosynthesis
MISVILNVYKRPHMLEKQIDAILNQSIDVETKDIHVWYNFSDVKQHLPLDRNIKTYNASWNTKFFGRFTIPLLCRTKYVAMFDDDVLPQPDWLRNCIETINNPSYDGVLGGSGVIVKYLGDAPPNKNSKDKPFTKVGWNGQHLEEPYRVDFVGHAWFFRQEVAKYLWYEEPYTWDNAEDIMFSYLAQKYGGVNTFVPPHSVDRQEAWCTDTKTGMRVGRDDQASWRKLSHKDVRYKVCQHCIDSGWDTVNGLR